MKSFKNTIYSLILVGVIVLAVYGVWLSSRQTNAPMQNIDLTQSASLKVFSPTNSNINAVAINAPAQQILSGKVVLGVPYISEAPDGNWTGPWKNACEEASIAMVQNYYLGKTRVPIADQKSFMQSLFDAEDKIWGSNVNTDVTRTLQLIEDYSMANGKIVEEPTIEQIKAELDAKRPVIVPLYGFDLHNPNIPFVPLPRGTSYHMIVIIGYDDSTQEFITNDDGDTKAGAAHPYAYDVLMNAIHDYSFTTKHADGPARAIFTFPKLAKAASSSQIYYLSGNYKQLVDPAIFQAKGWTENMVNTVEQVWLDSFKTSSNIIK